MASEHLYLIADVYKSRLALPVQHVLEIVSMPPVRSVCNADPRFRGVINLRDRVLPVLDLRAILGMPTLQQEINTICDMLDQRAEDHVRWINELERCVETREQFTLARDPHLCAFGKWFYSFKTTDRELQGVLALMERPHAEIHGLANRLLAMVAEGRTEEARQEIQAARKGVLQSVLDLLKQAQTAVRANTSDLAVIIEDCDRERQAAISIDAVDNIEEVPEDAISPLDAGTASIQITPLAIRLAEGKSLALMINADYLTALASRAA